jgi:pimeloyl-ACP methyl ester carboxylesterase
LLRFVVGLPGRRDDKLAVVNGLFGDQLADEGSPLAVPMTVRSGADVLELERDALRASLPGATGSVVVLVHGLMCTEAVWQFPDDPATTYGTLLARDHGVTAVAVRYNTGRHISASGRDLARLLHDLRMAWPVPLHDITLIGHSMGGLVIRSACHYASATRPWRSRRRRSWRSLVRRVVLLGVPNTGAPLEVLANVVSSTLASVPLWVARSVGRGLDTRSAGIRDLRFGAITDDEWVEHDPAARRRPVPHSVRPLRRARYLLAAGSVTADPDHPVSQIVGDVLVTFPSASGAVPDLVGGTLFPGATVSRFPRVTHMALANRPEVYDAIHQWWPAPHRPRFRAGPFRK